MQFLVSETTSKTNVYSMHGRFMLTPANVLFLELRYEILKFFMHASFLYNLEDILQEKSAKLHAVLKNSHKLCQ